MSRLSLRGQVIFALVIAGLATALHAFASALVSPVFSLAMVAVTALAATAWFEGGAIRRRLLVQVFLLGWSGYLLIIGANLPAIVGSAALFWCLLTRWQQGRPFSLGSVVADVAVLAIAAVIIAVVFDGRLFGVFLSMWAFFLLVSMRQHLFGGQDHAEFPQAGVDRSYAAARWRLQQLLERDGELPS